MKNLLRREQTQGEKAPCKGGSGISYVATKGFLEQLGVGKGKGTGRLQRNIALQTPWFVLAACGVERR